ncbi:MAG: acetate/propionate family kinase [Kofleriaceae bacterium]|nr:acetate/propionate family kinase [Kofleriaceae bacterium]
MRVLLLNAGSSSLKCTLVESEGAEVLARAKADWAGAVSRYEREGPGDARVAEDVSFRRAGDAARRALDDFGLTPSAVGHRIVHGGSFTHAVRITDSVRSHIAQLSELAPLHNPPGLEALAAAEELLPDVPHVAVFDTAFHQTLPPEAFTYPLPRTWLRNWNIRRYGFHGLSHEYAAKRTAEMLARPVEELRTVVCHLGHGCSATAVLGGRSVDTTMGFTPLDGLMMATRSGSVDPGIIAYVERQHDLDAIEIERTLNHDAGLVGVSEVSADMREVLAARAAGHERARLAVDVYAHRVRQAIGALAVTLGGIDALAFTGGVGEHAAEVRALACRGLGCLGLVLDERANASCHPDADIATRGSRGRILVIESREDLAMLVEVMEVVGGQA